MKISRSNAPAGDQNYFFKSLITLSAAIVVCLAVFHAWEIYTPVPAWDMWTGYLGFAEHLSQGDWSIWWAPHVEHRILLGRLLFWVDANWFHGTNVVLIVANYFIVSLTALILCRMLARLIPGQEHRTLRTVISSLVTGFLFLLCQAENLTWAFQGVFDLAFLLPLSGLYFLQKSASSSSRIDFFLACLLGLSACGTMANGVLALPVLSIYSIATRQRLWRTAALITLSVAAAWFYLHGLEPNSRGLLSQVKGHITSVSIFILSLLGNPFYYLSTSLYRAQIAQTLGTIYLFAVLIKVLDAFRKPRPNFVQVALLCFVLYVFLGQLAIASGRMFLGLNVAWTLHYTTPAILSWSALAILCAPDIAATGIGFRRILGVGALLLLVLMISLQVRSLGRSTDFYFARRLGILSLALGINDQSSIQSLSDPTYALKEIPPIAEKAYDEHLAIFGQYPYLQVREQFGTPMQQKSTQACDGALDLLQTTTDPRYAKVRGWIAAADRKNEPAVIRFLNEDGVEIGYGLTGARPDLARVANTGSFFPGYGGYILASAAGKEAILQGEDRNRIICRMAVRIPALLFSVRPGVSAVDQVNVADTDVLPGHTWNGTDFNRTNFRSSGLRLFGSYDEPGVRSIELWLKRGDRLLYRSGRLGGQEIEISGQPPVLLPVANEWTLLDFSTSAMPTQPTVTKLIDPGTGLDEWSAIAVREHKLAQ